MCILPPVPACTYPSLTVGYLDAWFSSGRLEDADGLLIGLELSSSPMESH